MIPAWQRRFNRKFQTQAVLRMNDLLKEKGMTQRELAERAGWKEPFVSRILSGKANITLRTLAKFEEAVGGDVLVVTKPADARKVSRPTEAPSIRTVYVPVAEQLRVDSDAYNDFSYALN
jgi:transcriptional regulator with XRE-family HTH domain